jgi:hypothetical protein
MAYWLRYGYVLNLQYLWSTGTGDDNCFHEMLSFPFTTGVF